jgi:hypothetical protein
MKQCTRCKQIKNIIEFTKDKYNSDGLDNWCKDCKRIWQSSKRGKEAMNRYNRSPKGKKTAKKYYYSKKGQKRYKNYSLTPQGIFAHIKGGANHRKILFDINKEDFVEWYNNQTKKCIYCDRIEIEAIKDRNGNYKRLSIDRKDNNKGYTLDNIVLCCHRCNTIKSKTFTYEQMIRVGNILKEGINK